LATDLHSAAGLRIVISYRRRDTPSDARQLRDLLVAQFGRENVFLDIDAIPPGVDWKKRIETTIANCDVFLALIGLYWRARRLDDPYDFLRNEIEAALNADLHVIPILLHGASMPAVDKLPESLAALPFRQGLRIDNDDWDRDVGKLMQRLEEIRAEETEKLRARAAEQQLEADRNEREREAQERAKREQEAAEQAERDQKTREIAFRRVSVCYNPACADYRRPRPHGEPCECQRDLFAKGRRRRPRRS
jgi:TIR domain